MMKTITREEIKKIYSRDWKEKNIEYLTALEKFFDIVDNEKNEALRLDIIYQMLKCDEILTKIAEDTLKNK